VSKYFPSIQQRRWKWVLGAILTRSLLASNVWAAPPVSTHFGPTAIDVASLQMETTTVGWAIDSHLASSTALFGGQILHTVDGGRQWTNVTPPHVTFNGQAGPIILPHDTVTDFVSPSIAWAATETAVSYPGGSGTILLSATHDRGMHWQQWTVHLPQLADRAVFNPVVNQVDFVNARIGWMVFGPLTGPDGGMGASGMELWRTTNGGHSWTRVYQTAHGINGSAVTFNSATNGWMVFQANNVNIPVGGVNTLERTTNGGRTWTAASVNLISGLNLTGVLPAFDGAHGILLTTMGLFAILRTDNGGQHWSDLSTTPIIVPSFWTGQMIGDQVVWILTPTKLWRSTTGGRLWTVQSTAAFLHPGKKGNDTKRLDFITAEIGWMWDSTLTSSRVWKTTDGGRSWTSWTPMVVQ